MISRLKITNAMRVGIAFAMLLIPSLAPIADARTLVSEAGDPEPQESLSDHKAKAFNITGEVMIMKAGETEWEAVQEGSAIDEGDQIRTGPGASVAVYYDLYYLNYIRVESDSQMTFTRIEPTSLALDEGSIFNNLDGLVEGSEYEIVTPTSVSAVRGTRFLREYDPESQLDQTYVSHGTVEINPFIDESKTTSPLAAFRVTENNAMIFDRESIRSKRFELLQPKPIPEKKLNRMRGIQDELNRHVENAAGGAKELKRAHAAFNELKKSPDALRNVESKLRRSGSDNNHDLRRPLSPRVSESNDRKETGGIKRSKSLGSPESSGRKFDEHSSPVKRPQDRVVSQTPLRSENEQKGIKPERPVRKHFSGPQMPKRDGKQQQQRNQNPRVNRPPQQQKG